jgi:hypothetical protein
MLTMAMGLGLGYVACDFCVLLAAGPGAYAAVEVLLYLGPVEGAVPELVFGTEPEVEAQVGVRFAGGYAAAHVFNC